MPKTRKIMEHVNETSILNVCIEDFPMQLQTQQIVEHFQKFGDVASVNVINTTQPAKCFIEFKEAWSAAAALKSVAQTIASKAIKVTPCDNSVPQLTINHNIPDLSICVLNDDCLLAIMHLLNLHEIVRLSMSHPRLEQSCLNLSDVLFLRELELTDLLEWSVSERRHYFKIAGAELRRIDILDENLLEGDVSIDIINEFCTNLEHLYMWLDRTDAIVILDRLHLSNLTVIDLGDCNLKDDELLPLCGANKLESLSLHGNEGIRGDFLPQLKQVKRLKLSWCYNITEQNFKQMCFKHKLIFLDITQTELWSYFSLTEDMFPALETLALTYAGQADSKLNANFPKLKYLQLEDSNRIRFSLIEKLSNNLVALKLEAPKGRDLKFGIFNKLSRLYLRFLKDTENLVLDIAEIVNLEQLHIENAVAVAEDHLMDVIEKAKKLSWLSLNGRMIELDLVVKIINVLAQSPVNRPKLQIFVTEHCIDKNIFEHPKYKDSQHLLLLKLENQESRAWFDEIMNDCFLNK